MTGIPFVKGLDFEYGRPDRLSPFVTRVIARNPGPFTYTGSGTYLIGGADDPLAVIDPGPDLDEHLGALLAAIGGRPVGAVLITHTHRDHCGLARRFADATKAPVKAFGPHPEHGETAAAIEEGSDRRFAPDELMRGGDAVSGDGWTLRAVETPGHLSNHLCFALEEEKLLFTGDHVMGWSTTVVAPPDGDMGDYLDSLDLLLARDDRRYLPTHGAPIDEPARFVRAIRTHRRIRDGQILDQLKRGRDGVPEMVAAIYADIDARLHGAAGLNVLAHLIRLVDVGAVAVDGEPTLRSRFRLIAEPPGLTD